MFFIYIYTEYSKIILPSKLSTTLHSMLTNHSWIEAKFLPHLIEFWNKICYSLQKLVILLR